MQVCMASQAAKGAAACQINRCCYCCADPASKALESVPRAYLECVKRTHERGGFGSSGYPLSSAGPQCALVWSLSV